LVMAGALYALRATAVPKIKRTSPRRRHTTVFSLFVKSQKTTLFLYFRTENRCPLFLEAL